MVIDKRGWLKTIEVTLAICIVFGFLFILVHKPVQTYNDVKINEKIMPILDYLAENVSFRQIVSLDPYVAQEILNQSFYSLLLYDGLIQVSQICSLDNQCLLQEEYKNSLNNKEIFSFERTLALNSSNFKKIKVYVWRV